MFAFLTLKKSFPKLSYLLTIIIPTNWTYWMTSINLWTVTATPWPFFKMKIVYHFNMVGYFIVAAFFSTISRPAIPTMPALFYICHSLYYTKLLFRIGDAIES